MSILLIHNGIFIFHSDTYLYHDLTAKEVDNSPKVIQTAFNIPFSTIDAALRWDDETVFFFNGMDCLKYNLMTKSVVSGYPKKILFEWRGIWPSDLSEAIRMDSKVFFFRKTQCISYDVQLGKADTGYPKPIADEWRGVSDSVDGAEYLGQDKILFLRGDQVIRYDVQHRHADAGYPIDVQAYVQGYSSTNTATDFNTDMRIIHDYVSAAIGASNKIASSYLSAIHNLQATIQAASPSETRPEVLASILKVGLITAEKLMIPEIKEASGTELRPPVDLLP